MAIKNQSMFKQSQSQQQKQKQKVKLKQKQKLEPQIQLQQQEPQKDQNTSTPKTAPPRPPKTAVHASAANGGPRVSFNRDVHVKRIGKRTNELSNYETTNLQEPQLIQPYHHELPSELNAESIRKEAALVLSQAGSHKSKAENADNIPIFKVKTKRPSSPNKFNSLPTRKQKSPAKPVSRSVSDASAKKHAKRPSIFSIFSRKSESNVSQIERDPRFEDSGGRRLVRSKSDVGSYSRGGDQKSKKPINGTKSLKETKHSVHGSSKLLTTPLSPILENALKEDLFEKQFNRERRKSDAITDREKHESGLDELLERSRHQAEVDGSLLAKKPISSNIKNTILKLQAKSNENMHSSQIPAPKLPLTKGVTVNGMVKRLSRERFTPPPTIIGPAFSYIRPNEGITYAQLELGDDQQHNNTIYRLENIRLPRHDFRTPPRDTRSTEPHASTDVTDFTTSHPAHINTRSKYINAGRMHSESPMHSRDSFSPVVGPTTIQISSSHSPSPWKQLSPRNLSDEDEGLGIETRKYFDADFSHRIRSKSPPEPPIVPVIRSITPPHDISYNYRDDPADDLGYRRARLESRLLTRRFGETTPERGEYHRSGSPDRTREVRAEYQLNSNNDRYPKTELDEFGVRFNRPHTRDNLQKYSPERSQIDIISPTANTMPKVEKTSRYKHTKYYDNGTGGIKEVFQRETLSDNRGNPHVRESHHREILESPAARIQFTDYEPKSLDSQFTSTDQYRSSPENMKRYDFDRGHQFGLGNEDIWQSSLKRDKLQQRSFDKGDSGIENDFRKESFNGDITSRWRKRTFVDDMRICEVFLTSERHHSELLYPYVDRHRNSFVYRERSIDDGSHYDPHLDRYPTATSTLRRTHLIKERQTNNHDPGTLKRTKKVGGFEKVKQLFTGGNGGNISAAGSSGSSAKRDREHLSIRANSTASSIKTLPKDKYMVKEEEMRSRYREHHGALQNGLSEPKPKQTTDISMRRRLSTPKASPLLIKRTSLEKKQSPLVQKNSSEKPEKTSWFKSLDRRSKSKSKEKLDVYANGTHETTSMKRTKPSRTAAPPPIPSKNLRFFGDTDLDSNPPTITKATTTLKSRPSIASSLNRSQKYSQSAYHLNRINNNTPNRNSTQIPSAHNSAAIATSRHKSSSMHDLENDESTDEVEFHKRRHYSRSCDLDDISESASENEERHKRQNGISARSISRERLDRSHRYDEHYRRSSDRPLGQTSVPNDEKYVNATSTLRRHIVGPPKPARSAERRGINSYQGDRDRHPPESSGTEGESSIHSQRSVVYLHATTVGAIPQPYHLSRRRSFSRDDLSSSNGKQQTQPLQPMTRTVSRSVSLLAPWKPKLISEGYEINYSQEQNKKMSTLPRKQHQTHNGNTSTLPRLNKNSEAPSTRPRRNELLKDEQSSLRNSSTTSASKSALSSNVRSDTRRKFK